MFFPPPNSNGKLPESPLAVARILQIIVACLMLGVSVYAGVVLVQGGLSEPPKPPSMAVMAAGMAAVCVVMSFVIPTVIVGQQARAAEGNASALLGLFQTKTIIAGALLEGPAFFNLFALSTEHQCWSLAIVVVLLALMAMQIPSETRIAHWVETKQLESQ